jgi:hypothetical protein
VGAALDKMAIDIQKLIWNPFQPNPQMWALIAENKPLPAPPHDQ